MDDILRRLWELIWKVIDDDKKLEVASYLILQTRNDREHWNLRPHTKDGGRDVEMNDRTGIYYCEAKYRKNEKLTLEDVGDDIASAILHRIDRLLITTNTDIQLNLSSYAEKFNKSSNITHKKLIIDIIDGQQFQQLLIVENTNNFKQALKEILVLGYSGNDAIEKTSIAKKSYQHIGEQILNELEAIKKRYSQVFACNPQLSFLEDNRSHIKIEDFFLVDFGITYNKEYVSRLLPNIKIVVGTEFTCEICIKNLFANPIHYRVEFSSNVGIQIFRPFKMDKDILFIDDIIPAYAVTTIEVPCKINKIPQYFDIIVRGIEIESEHVFRIRPDCFDNRLLHIPYITTLENQIVEEIVSEINTPKKSKIKISLFQGIGGVGKSTIINMIMDKIRNTFSQNKKIFHFPSTNLIEIAREILIETACVRNLYTKSKQSQIIKTLLFEEEYSYHIIIDKLFSENADVIANKEEARSLAFLISSILTKLSHNCNIILIFEDIHIANAMTLVFLESLIINQYRDATNINIILAERITLQYDNSQISTFYSNIRKICGDIIIIYTIENFTRQDAKFLVDHYIEYEDIPNKESCLNRIVNISGTNPLNLINYLLALEKNTTAFFHNDGRLYIHKYDLDYYAPYKESIIKNRFQDILNERLYKHIFIYIVLFKNNIPKQFLLHLFGAQIVNTLSILQEYRFIFIGTCLVRFDHESLYECFKNQIMPTLTDDVISCAVSAYRNFVNVSKEIKINILYHCPNNYNNEFKIECKKYINELIDTDNKKLAIEYCDLYLNKYINAKDEDHSSLLDYILINVIKYTIAIEYSNIIDAITQLCQIEDELYKMMSYFDENHKKEAQKIQQQLYSTLGSAYQQVSRPNKSIEYLNKQLSCCNINKKTICKIYNRLGVSYRQKGNFNKAKLYLFKSLMRSIRYEEYYLIYHNYYDLSGCYLEEGRILEAQKCLERAINMDSSLFNNRRHVAEMDRSTKKCHFQVLFNKITTDTIEEIEYVMHNAYDGNFTWHYCNIANIRGVVDIKKADFISAQNRFYNLLLYCKNYSQSNKQKIYILNNLIASLYFQKKIDNIQTPLSELQILLKHELDSIMEIDSIPIRLILVILNMRILQIDLKYNIAIEKIINGAKTKPIIKYCKHSYKRNHFYLIYK